MRFNKRHLLGLMAALPLAWLSACGGSDNNGNDANVRLVNASAGYASLDLYVADTKEVSAVAFGAGSDYASVQSGDSVKNVLTSAGSTSELLNQTRSLGSSKKYTIVAYGWEGALKSTIFTDDEDAADTDKTKVGAMNGAVGAGSLDIYLTGEDESLDSAEPVHSAVPEGSTGTGYFSVTSGTYRLRVTAAGDTSDVRLDVSGVVLTSKQVLTLVTTPGSGGVLVNGIGVVQDGAVTPYLNTKARVRVVPAVAGNAQVTMTVGTTTVATAAQSPSIGLYKLVPAGSATLHTVVDGTTLADQDLTLAAGADMTVLVTGTSAAAATVNPIADDNRLPTTASRFKIRLVHAVPSLASQNLSMLLNSSFIAEPLAFGQASEFSTQATATDALLEVSAPSAGTFYTKSGVNFVAGGVYTLFMFDYPTAPNGVLTNTR